MSVKELNTVLERILKIRKNFKKDPKDRYNIAYFKNRLLDLNSEWTRAKELYTQVLDTIQPENKVKFEQEYDRAEECFYEIRDTFTNWLLEFQKEKKTSSTEVTSEYSKESRIAINLPKVEIPRFNGKFENWPQFKDLFESLVNGNGSLSNTERFHYLKQALAEEAANLLKHINCIGDNYDEAWDTLVQRYQNERTLVNTYLRKIFAHAHLDGSAKSLEKFLNVVHESLVTLKSLKQAIEQWDSIIVYTVESKLDNDSRMLWEQALKGATTIPKWETLQQFLRQRLQVLEVIEKTKCKKAEPHKYKAHVAADDKAKCSVCNRATHQIFQCETFLKASIAQRRKQAAANKACFNCLRSGHTAANCKSTSTCKKCKGKHNTLLHSEEALATKRDATCQGQHTAPTSMISNICHSNTTTLLPTARINIAANGRLMTVKALIDQGSQRNFISERIIRGLGIKRRNVNVQISGVGNQIIESLGTATIHAQSIHCSKSKICFEALILRSITGILPNVAITDRIWYHLQGLQLADPEFNVPSKVECLIGASEIPALLLPGIKQAGATAPMAQETIFGWVLSGPVTSLRNTELIVTNICRDVDNLDIVLRRFWEVEELPVNKPLRTQEEQECEVHYRNTFKRDSSNKFIVQLPLKANPQILGDSRKQAERRFKSLEKRFERNNWLKEQYAAVITEYLTEGHMDEVTEQRRGTPTYYMPHHAVIKEASTTTRVRVVFDASMKTTSGHSLNSIMKVGPVLQADLYTLLINWRRYQYVVTADIKAMYRQIWIDDEQHDLQRILWRHTSGTPIKEYRLKTVTFGTAAAPYLATKTLMQLAEDGSTKFPIGSHTLLKHLYVDDMLTGADTVSQCRIIRDDVISLLASGGFLIRKWSANHPQILKGLPNDSIESSIKSWMGPNEILVRTLGFEWDPIADNFHSKPLQSMAITRVTKRTIASEVAKLFDPLGWISPVVIIGKVLLQHIWLLQVDWDDEVPERIIGRWNHFLSAIHDIQMIQVPRWIGLNSKAKEIQVHGFCDSSERAYAACVYVRVHQENEIVTRLVTSKSRVAPLKKVTLPRLELCGAILLVRLLEKVNKIYELIHCPTYAWSDSKIVLAWIQQPPYKWKTYVANRISEIHDHKYVSRWGYVPTRENPADLPTRGLNAKDLAHRCLWWNGPNWLQKTQDDWPKGGNVEETTTEAKAKVLLAMNNLTNNEILNRYSNMNQLLKITAWCRRWRNKIKQSCITVKELEVSETWWIKVSQAKEFSTEIHHLQTNKQIPKNSKIKDLTPFLDAEGVLRMKGRLRHTTLSFEEKHLIILPGRGHLTKLIIQRAHLQVLHGGVQLTLTQLRRRFWICRGRQAVKVVIHGCHTCVRFNQKTCQQIMADLPVVRVTQNKPFQVSGLDYAGPIDIRRHKGRGSPTLKTYIAVFVCFATKAIHLELVTDLSTQALMAAIRRFVARRGTCSDIYSDNGRNMVGAANHFKTFKADVKTQHDHIENQVITESITWHFIPPGAPHFGGLWESAVKSTKTHLKKVLGVTTFTIEEMMTALCQIEACLNSRPLCKLSDDPNDDAALTPNHFLTGTISVVINEDSSFSKTALLNRWNAVQYRIQQFWRQWSTEYLNTIRTRTKWHTVTDDLLTGQLVLIKNDCLPPAKWSKGIITEIVRGADDHVRIVSVRTPNGILQRPITKICLLPTQLEKPGPVIECQNKPSTNENHQEGGLVHIATESKSVNSSYRLKLGPKWKWWWIVLTIIVCLQDPGFSQEQDHSRWYNISKFTNQTGLLYEHKSNIKWVTSYWTILAHYNLTTYQTELNRIGTLIEKVSHWCRTQQIDREYCAVTTARFHYSWRIIQNKDSLLRNHHGTMHKRSKRGLLNVIGSVANKLFGVLDDDFAQNYRKDIVNIRDNSRHLEYLIQRQTSTVDLMKTLVQQHDQQMENFTQTVNGNFVNALNSIEKVKTVAETQLMLDKYIIVLMWDIRECQRIQDSLLQLILDAQHGVISAEVIPIQTLQTQLSLISGHLPNGQHVLGASKTNWVDLYKVIELKVAALEDTILFECRLPIVDSEEFELYRIHSLPTLINQTYVYIIPSIDNLAFNARRDRYFVLNNQDITKCKPITNKLICDLKSPIYNLNAREYACEVKTYLNKHIDTDNCVVSTMIPRALWMPLQDNTWIFILDQSHVYELSCQHIFNHFHLRLEGEGLLRMASGCVLRHQSFIIRSSSEGPSSFIQINHIIPQWNFTNRTTSDPIAREQQTQLKWQRINWTAVRSQLEEGARNQGMDSSSHDNYQNVILGIMLLLLIGLTTSGVILFRKHRAITPKFTTQTLSLPPDDDCESTR